MKQVIITTLSAVVFLSSCGIIDNDRIKGNGDIKKEARNESGFQSIEVSGAIKVFVKQDSIYTIMVETDGNLMQHIETYMDKNTLVIRPERGTSLKPSKSVKVYVTGPRFRYLNVSGASGIQSENRLSSEDEFFVEVSGASEAVIEVRSPMVGVKSNGASTAVLSGETKALEIDCSGASHAKCFDLLSENANVELSGASGGQVFASVAINARVSGAASLTYKGNPTVTKDVSGAGSVKKIE